MRTEFLDFFEKIKDKPFPEKRPRDIWVHSWGWSQVCTGKRYYISDKKYYIFEGRMYRNRAKELVQSEPFLGVELIEVSTKEVIGLDLFDLCYNKFQAFEGHENDNKIIYVESDSFINQYISDAKKRVKPYITNKELVDIFVEFVNNRYLYFNMKSYRVNGGVLGIRSRCVLNAYFVDSIVRPY